MAADAHGNLSDKRLVIFGCGYVGAALARHARAHGLEVVALTRNESTAAALRGADIDVVEADLATDAWHEHVRGGTDFAVNCVSSGGPSADDYRRSYFDGMRSILAWARRRPVGTLVFTSSTSVYPQGGTPSNEIPRIDESVSTSGARETAQVLLQTENLLKSPEARASCGRWFVLRLAGIYGPGRHHLLDEIRAGKAILPGRGDHHLNLAHRDDIVTAIWAVLMAPKHVAGEIFNVADGAPATKAAVVAWLAEKSGRPAPRFTGEPTGRRGLAPDRIIDNAKLRSMLGWAPAYPSFREGFASLV